ncbi:formate dehydrogenase subunit gamma [Granulosicoccus antarcticus]|uniref:Formate dehydrogenase, nitrate-inducible, cytochrome b556(Fdn) subunit n=1 Tax=Granulosicoccus antarcticus IMCC3135 TaxID=1192854 RepID=A0A2Z2NYV3_9GAMM|nr:formate dehydrogenase subunit gamma [Granulosicoccus antarcticus]ASJ75111.1 Formate dehydrogenase, nitrate-inducible, cytochrome b556(Fdn) subunit [Granulosicoccus antarcticus IMCC3135]
MHTDHPNEVPASEPVRQKMSSAKKRKITTYSLLAILALAFILPLGSYSLHFLGSEAIAQETGASVNPRSNYWRAVNDGVSGYSAVKGQESNVLIGPGGVRWQALRDGPVASYAPWGILIMLLIVTTFHLIKGRSKLEEPRSGKTIKRWNWLDRTVHWVTAVSFIALAITGLSMLVGKVVLIPLLGKAGFSLWAQASITIHNVIGPVFSIGIVLMIVMWIWYNVPNAVDIKWFKQGGGIVGDGHPSAGRMNGGEKVWFWAVTFLGLAVCASGLLMVAPSYGITIPAALDFLPLVGGTREQMQQANLIHAVVSLIWAAIAVGHIYIGTAGTEGAFEGMATGYVSAEWAKQHHDLWYEQVQAEGKIIDASAEPGQGVDHEGATVSARS